VADHGRPVQLRLFQLVPIQPVSTAIAALRPLPVPNQKRTGGGTGDQAYPARSTDAKRSQVFTLSRRFSSLCVEILQNSLACAEYLASKSIPSVSICTKHPTAWLLMCACMCKRLKPQFEGRLVVVVVGVGVVFMCVLGGRQGDPLRKLLEVHPVWPDSQPGRNTPVGSDMRVQSSVGTNVRM
jgi:hypothetical protein